MLLTVILIIVSFHGATENARPENAGLKMTDKILANSEQNYGV